MSNITLVEIDTNVQGESTTSLAISTTVKTITLTESQPFIKGETAIIKYDDSNYMSGTILSIDNTSLRISVTSITGSGTYTDWLIDSQRTLYFGTETYVSSDNKEYLGDIIDAGSIAQYMYDVASTFGESKITIGDIVLNNLSGKYDYVRKLGFKSASLRIKQVTTSNNITTILSGTCKFAEVSLNRVTFSISDRLADLNKDAQKSLFDGSNSGPTGIEGTIDSLKGVVKPFIFGKCRNIEAPLLNSSKLIYGINFDNDGNTLAITSVDAVRDAGVALTIDTAVGTSGVVTNLAAMQAATIASGKYIVCLSESLIRLGSIPLGAVTIDATESVLKPGSLVKNIIEKAGFTSGDYINSTFTALDTFLAYNHGVYVNSGTTFLAICNDILSNIGGFISCTSDNKFFVGYLKSAELFASSKSFDDYSTIDFSTISSKDDGLGIPPKQIKLNYNRNYKVMNDSDFAGSVSQDDRDFYSKEYLTVESVVNSKIDTKHYNAPVFNLNTLIDSNTDAQTELARQLTLRQKERNFYSFKTYDLSTLAIGDVINISNSQRFDLQEGKNVVIMGKEVEFAKSSITYIVWG
jgi:hypothetical protein